MIRMATGAMAFALMGVLLAYVLDAHRGELGNWLEWHWGQAQLFATFGAVIGASLVYTLAPGTASAELRRGIVVLQRLIAAGQRSIAAGMGRMTAAATKARQQRRKSAAAYWADPSSVSRRKATLSGNEE